MLLLLLVGGCIVLCWRWPAVRDWIRAFPRARLREIGWGVGLLVLLLCAVAIARGAWGWPVAAAGPAVALLILCAPPTARRLAPVALACLGAAGVVLVLSDNSPISQPYQLPAGFWAAAVGRSDAWRVTLLIQSLAFLLAGVWLAWRARSRRSALMPAGPAAGRRGRLTAWTLVAPASLAAIVLLVDHDAGHPAWVAAAAAAGVSLIVAIAFPAVAADLSAVGLAAVGLCGIALAQQPPTVNFQAVAAPGAVPVQGVAARVAGLGAPAVPPAAAVRGVAGRPAAIHVAIVGTTVGAPVVLLAAVEAGLLLAFGLWLVPRTVFPHARALLRPDAELAGRVRQLAQTRADAVDTAAAELRRVERDLHDGAQARLVAVGMSLRAAERLIPTSPQAAIALVAEARETSSKALTELRDLVRGIFPPVLADRGLADAVRALALDTPMRTEADIDLPGRLDAPVESACYFAIAEALANAVKHSGARLVQIRIRHTADRPRPPAGRPVPGVLRIEVTDNGGGGADPSRGTGLHGVERRLGTFDGILAVSSPAGGPTMIIMEIPCALSSPRTFTC